MIAESEGQAATSALPTVGEPFTKNEIVDELRALHASSTAFWNRFDHAEFFAPLGAAWSPAENVRHLDRSIKPLTQALRLPVPVIWLIFGPARRPSRGFIEIRAAYRAELEAGLTAPKRFVPPPEPTPAEPADLAEARRVLMVRRDLRAQALLDAIEEWDERNLDRCRLPHPAPGLGKLTVREMLLFTVYHNLHHVLNAARRASAAD